MENSLKGILVTVTIIGLFMTAILSFIVLFPQEQGITFSGAGQHGYLTIAQTNTTSVENSLTSINNQSTNAFNQWDITQGFMGSNQLKQSQTSIFSMVTGVFTNLNIIATELFGQGSPILYALGILSLLASGYLIYAIILWVRTGR